MKTELRHINEPLDEYENRALLLYNELVQVLKDSGEIPEVMMAALTNVVRG
jgi:hypothetical protein